MDGFQDKVIEREILELESQIQGMLREVLA